MSALDGAIVWFLYVICRVGGAMAFLPFFSTSIVPARVRMLVAIAVAGSLTPIAMNAAAPGASGAWGAGAPMILLREIAIGMSFGVTARVIFAAIENMAMLCSMSVGLSAPFMPPIEADESLPPLASMLSILATMCFVASNAHLRVVSAMAESFVTFPVGEAIDTTAGLSRFLSALGSGFAISLRLAAPFVLLSTGVNLAFGVMNRFSGQLPVYFLALPVLLAGGLWITYASDLGITEFLVAIVNRGTTFR
jgi:flagellar biosynthesis protein FliR